MVPRPCWSRCAINANCRNRRSSQRRGGQKYAALNAIPGPPVYPIIGSVLSIMPPDKYEQRFVPDFVQKYGHNGVMRYWIGFIPIIDVFEPETIRQVIGTAKGAISHDGSGGTHAQCPTALVASCMT